MPQVIAPDVLKHPPPQAKVVSGSTPYPQTVDTLKNAVPTGAIPRTAASPGTPILRLSQGLAVQDVQNIDVQQ
jgi:hypothetical protein